MAYVRHDDLIKRKRELGVNDVALAGVINKAPITVTHKLLGYLLLTALERKKITEFLDKVESEKKAGR